MTISGGVPASADVRNHVPCLEWHGSQAEADQLLRAVHKFATCIEFGMADCCDSTLFSINCPAHGLLDSQFILDLLLGLIRMPADLDLA